MTQEKAGEGVAEQEVKLCSRCGKALGNLPEHQQDGECELAAATPNEHRLTKGELRLYKPEHHLLLLAHGRQKFAFAFNIVTSNQACNHWQQIAQKYMHMRAPTQRMIQNYDWVLGEALAAHGWTLADILPICEELVKANAESGPRLVIPS